MWALGGRGIYVTVNTFKGETKIHVRKYARDDESGQIHPTKNGITLSPVEWRTFFENVETIDNEVKRLENVRGGTSVAQSLATNSPAPWPAASPASAQAREVMKLRHVTSVGKLKCFSLQLVLVQQRNFRLQITIARWIHNFILLHSYTTFGSNAIPIPSLTPYNWVFTANLLFCSKRPVFVWLVGSWIIISMNVCIEFSFM